MAGFALLYHFSISPLPSRIEAYEDDLWDPNVADTKATVKSVLDDATASIIAQKEEVARLKNVADKHPFYKYNGVWSRELQNLVGPQFQPRCIDFSVMLIRIIRLPRLNFVLGSVDCRSTRDQTRLHL